MRFDEATIRPGILQDFGRLRRWCESMGIELCAFKLLEAFRKTSSPKDRETIWSALLEVLSIKEEENLSEALFREWVDELLRGLGNRQPEIRRQALSALSDIAKHVADDIDVISNLVESLYDESQLVRGQAIYSVSGLASQPLVHAIADSLVNETFYKTALDDPDKGYIWHALFALDEVVDRLDLNEHERDEVARKLLQALFQVLSMPKASNLDIWKIGDSLGDHIKGKAALAILKEMFSNTNAVVRDSAVHGLGHLGGNEAIKLIYFALHDPAPEVKDEAQRALKEMSG